MDRRHRHRHRHLRLRCARRLDAWMGVGVLVALLAVALPGVALAGRAESAGVGLGVSVGAVFPRGDGAAGEEISFSDVGLAWGFWVDIPIVWKFHISPSAELYNIGGDVGDNTATDICLNFKFIVPISILKLFLGASGGVTNAYAEYNANAGVLAGVSFPLFANLEAFLSAKYKVIIHDPNVHAIHTNAGVLFVF